MAVSREPSTEHRFLSVLFCDLVGSTDHQFRMETEQFAALLTDYRRIVFDRVRRRGGYVARTVGDGVLVFFGWPDASGRDAQAAVLCALDIAARMRRGIGAVPAAVRLAVETGWVLVGDIGASSDPAGVLDRADVVGAAPNIAARLQTIARPNGVVAGEGTLPLLGERFVTEPADTAGLKLPAPVAAVHVLAEAGAGDPLGRLRARVGNRLGQRVSAPVGREAELNALLGRWTLARQNNGQIVLLAGDPGMGKSNLLAALLAQIRPDDPEVMGLFCSAAARDSPFQPLTEPLRVALGLDLDADPASIRAPCADFAAVLGLSNPAAGDALATLLGAPPDDPPPPAVLRRCTVEALLRLVDRLQRERPLLILVEDVQWADPSTQDLLHEIAGRIADKRVLLIATHHSYDPIDWPDRPHLMRMPLAPLPPHVAHRLAAALALSLGIPLDEPARAAIVARAEGVPLFIEEFVRALGDRAQPVRLPGSVAQLLSARLDALGTARAFAQYASVLGKEAPVALLQTLSGWTPEQSEDALQRLTGSGVMVSRGVGSNAVLAFRHGLLGDAAYRAMPKRRVQELHRQVARALQRISPALALNAEEALGHHLAEAGETAEAATLFRAAAAGALASGAFKEAEAHARRAVGLAELLPNGARSPALLAALMPLGEALIAVRGYAHPEVQDVFERGARLALGMGTAHDMLPALRGLTSFYQVRGPMARAHELSARVLQIARLVDDPALVRQAARRHGWCLLCQGRIAEARVQLLSAIVHDGARTRVEDDDNALTLGHLAWVDWLTEGAAAALERARRAAALIGDDSRPLSAAYALGFVAVVHQLAGDRAGTAHFAQRCRAIAEPRGMAYWIAMANALAGWSEATGGSGDGLARLRNAIGDYSRTQGLVLKPYLLGLLAEAEQAAGTAEAAARALDEAAAVVDRIGADLFRPVLLRLQARNLAGPERQEVLRAAQQIAEAQGAASILRLLSEDAAAPERGQD